MVRVNITDRILVEPFGEELVVFDHTSSEIARFTGEHAAILRQVQDGATVDIESTPALYELLNSGVVVKAGTFSRRKALTLGAGAVGAGVISLSLPSMALAQSVSVQEVPFGFELKEGGNPFNRPGDGKSLTIALNETDALPNNFGDVFQRFVLKVNVNGQTEEIASTETDESSPFSDIDVTFRSEIDGFFNDNTTGSIFWEGSGAVSLELALNWQSPPA